MHVICGLGNPGKEYEATRHNMGFLAVDVLADKLGVSVRQLKFKALIGEGRIGTEKVLLVKPQTYMNLSGECIRPLMDFYKLEPEKLIVIYDDIDLSVGDIRVRAFGGPGTHNGMRSIVKLLGSDRFPRVRIGTGANGSQDLASYVLGKWTESERPLLADAVKNAADAAEAIVALGADKAMNRYNTKKKE